MSKSKIFSKTISLIKDKKQDYKPSQQSASKGQDSDEEGGKMYSINKQIKKKVIMIYNNDQQSPQQQFHKKTGVLKIQKKEQNKPQARVQGSFPIFIRNIKESITVNDLKQLINDESNILGISINNKQGTVTFSNQQSAEKAIEIINNSKDKCGEMRAVPNYRQTDKVIVIGEHANRNKPKDDGRLRMDSRESIFDRIQMKQ